MKRLPAMFFQSMDRAGSGDFATLLDETGCNTAAGVKRLAALFDVSPRTVSKYIKGEAAPPAPLVRLLLWESRWGWSVAASKADQYVKILEPQLMTARQQLAHLEARCAALEAENQRLKSGATPSRFIAANDSFQRTPSEQPDAKR